MNRNEQQQEGSLTGGARREIPGLDGELAALRPGRGNTEQRRGGSQDGQFPGYGQPGEHQQGEYRGHHKTWNREKDIARWPAKASYGTHNRENITKNDDKHTLPQRMVTPSRTTYTAAGFPPSASNDERKLAATNTHLPQRHRNITEDDTRKRAATRYQTTERHPSSNEENTPLRQHEGGLHTSLTVLRQTRRSSTAAASKERARARSRAARRPTPTAYGKAITQEDSLRQRDTVVAVATAIEGAHTRSSALTSGYPRHPPPPLSHYLLLSNAPPSPHFERWGSEGDTPRRPLPALAPP